MRKPMAVITLLVAVAAALANFAPVGEWNPIGGIVDTAVTSVVDSRTTTHETQCRATVLSTSSTDNCAVLMTPDELKAAVPTS